MATSQMAASSTAADATNVAYPNPNAAIKGLLGTSIEGLPSDIVAQVAAMSNEELFPLGEKALHDIADDIIVLAEIRNRFGRAKGAAILGYQCWKEFVERNSRYSVRTIQRRLNEVNGKDETKVNDRFKVGPNIVKHLAAISPHGILHAWCGAGGSERAAIARNEDATCRYCTCGRAKREQAKDDATFVAAYPLPDPLPEFATGQIIYQDLYDEQQRMDMERAHGFTTAVAPAIEAEPTAAPPVEDSESDFNPTMESHFPLAVSGPYGVRAARESDRTISGESEIGQWVVTHPDTPLVGKHNKAIVKSFSTKEKAIAFAENANREDATAPAPTAEPAVEDDPELETAPVKNPNYNKAGVAAPAPTAEPAIVELKEGMLIRIYDMQCEIVNMKANTVGIGDTTRAHLTLKVLNQLEGA